MTARRIIAALKGSQRRGRPVKFTGDWAMPQASASRKGCGAAYQSGGHPCAEADLAMRAARAGRARIAPPFPKTRRIIAAVLAAVSLAGFSILVERPPPPTQGYAGWTWD